MEYPCFLIEPTGRWALYHGLQEYNYKPSNGHTVHSAVIRVDHLDPDWRDRANLVHSPTYTAYPDTCPCGETFSKAFHNKYNDSAPIYHRPGIDEEIIVGAIPFVRRHLTVPDVPAGAMWIENAGGWCDECVHPHPEWECLMVQTPYGSYALGEDVGGLTPDQKARLPIYSHPEPIGVQRYRAGLASSLVTFRLQDGVLIFDSEVE